MKKTIILIAGLFVMQTALQTPPPVNEPHLQEIIDALASNDTLDQFIQAIGFFKKYSPSEIIDLKNAVINTHQGATTLYKYAKTLHKEYFTNLIDLSTAMHLIEDKNWQNVQEMINQPGFNPNLAIDISMGAKTMTMTLFFALFEFEAPLEIIQSILEKGALLTAKAADNKQNWELVVYNALEVLEDRITKHQKMINELQAELLKVVNEDQKSSIKRAIESWNTDLSALQQNDLPYLVGLIEMIERYAQQRGDKEVLQGIADAKQKFKIEI